MTHLSKSHITAHTKQKWRIWWIFVSFIKIPCLACTQSFWGLGGVWVKIESDYKTDKSYDFLKIKHWLWSLWEKTKPWYLWRENLRPQELWGREQYYFCPSESPLKVNSWRKLPSEVIPSCCKQFKHTVRLFKPWVAHLWLWRTNCKGLKFMDFGIEGCFGINPPWILRDNFNGLVGLPGLPEGSDTI